MSEKYFYYSHDHNVYLASCVDFVFIKLKTSLSRNSLEFVDDFCDCTPTCILNFFGLQDIKNRFSLHCFDTHLYSNDNMSNEFCSDCRESIFLEHLMFYLLRIDDFLIKKMTDSYVRIRCCACYFDYYIYLSGLWRINDSKLTSNCYLI